MMGLASYRPALVSALATARPPPRRRRRRLYLKATSCASTTTTSSRVLSHGGTSAPRSLQQPHRPRLVAAEFPSRPPPLAAGAVRGDATTGLAFLLFVLSVVMSSFLSLAIFSFPTWRALQQLEINMRKLSKVVAEEVPGTLSSLKLSCLEINDLTSQLKNFRQRLIINIWKQQ